MLKKQALLPSLFGVAAIFFLILYLTAEVSDYPSYYKEIRVHKGDSLAWKDPFYDDRHWKTEIPVTAEGNWWLRVPVQTSTTIRDGNHFGLLVSNHGSFQVFWDGHQIGENGKWGKTRQEEVEGKRFSYFLIPDSLVDGPEHVVALRIASFHDPGRKVYPAVVKGDYARLLRGELVLAVFLHILAGIFLVISFYYFSIYFISHRYLPYLLFGLLCFCFFSMIIFEYLRAYYRYPYSFHFTRLFAIAALAFLIANILCLFLLTRFQLKRRVLALISLNVILVLIWLTRDTYDDKTKTISVVAFTFALFICLVAIIKNKKASKEAFYGVLACLSCHINYDLMLYIGFSLLVVFMLISLSKQMKDQIRSREEAISRSKRLEVELLKKNIQPHFLMNSLTSLMEWVERSPKTSIEFINALAAEFEILNRISSQQLIPVSQELELCRSHLTIMSFRKDIHYQLETLNIDENESVPPAILLTLIENGISHNIVKDDRAVFTISFTSNAAERKWIVLAPGEIRHDQAGGKKGTGLTYIEARLEESYPRKWKLNSREAPNGWQTEIIVAH